MSGQSRGSMNVVDLVSCASTQDEARERLARLGNGDHVIVRAWSQDAGRGRDGRSWQDPPGQALLVSVGVRGPLPISVLDALPARLGEALLRTLDPDAHGIAWKSPNDLVAIEGGAKVAGILVDARTLAATVDEVIVGFGCNLSGEPFVTTDGRAATSLEACGLAVPALETIAAAILGQLRVTASE